MPLDVSSERGKIGKALLSAIDSISRDSSPERVRQYIVESLLHASGNIRMVWIGWDDQMDTDRPLSLHVVSPDEKNTVFPGAEQFFEWQRQLLASASNRNKPEIIRLQDKNCPLAPDAFRLSREWGLPEALLIPIPEGENASDGILSLYASRIGFFEAVGIEQFIPFAHIARIAKAVFRSASGQEQRSQVPPGKFREPAEEAGRPEDLSRTVRLYERMMESLNEGFLELDRENRILRSTPLAGKILEYDNQSLTGLPFESLLPENDSALPVRKALLSRTTVQTNGISLRKKDGTFLPVALSLIPAKEDLTEADTSMAVSFRDRSEQARVGDGLDEGERIYRQIVQHAPDGIYLFDPDTLTITHSNAALEKIMGFGTGELQGQSIARFLEIPPDVIRERIRSVKSNERPKNIPGHYRKKDGSLIPVSTSASLLTLLGQEQIMVIVRDMTEEVFIQELSRLEHEIDHKLLNQTPISRIMSEVSDRLLDLFHLSFCCFLRQEQSDLVPSVLALAGRPGTLADRFRTLIETEGSFQSKMAETLQALKQQSDRLPRSLVLPFQSLLSCPTPLEGHLFGLDACSNPRGFLLLLGPDETFPRQLNHLHHLSERIGIALLRYQDMERSRLQQAAMESSPTPMLIADRHGRIEWSNAAFEELTGYSLADIVAQTSSEDPEIPKPEYYLRLQQCLQSGTEFSGEVTGQKKDGTVCTTEMRITPIRQSDGEITHYIAVQTDVSDRKAREKKLQQWAFYDPLTGLPNRFLLNLLLEKEIARTDRSNLGVAVCFIDLDRFKPINDQFGHEAGDRILESVSDRLESVIRKGDIVGRLGGDEFVCLMPGIGSRQSLERILERILLAIRTPLAEGKNRITLGASIGVSLYPDDTTHDPRDLIHQADLAMYEAKREGGDRYVFFMDLSSPNHPLPIGR